MMFVTGVQTCALPISGHVLPVTSQVPSASQHLLSYLPLCRLPSWVRQLFGKVSTENFSERIQFSQCPGSLAHSRERERKAGLCGRESEVYGNNLDPIVHHPRRRSVSRASPFAGRGDGAHREPLVKVGWFDSWVRKIPWRRDRLPTPACLGFACGSAGKASARNSGTGS